MDSTHAHAHGHELKPMASTCATHGPGAGGASFAEMGATTAELDSAALARLGKREVLKRRFGFLSMFGFSCTILTTWEALTALFLVSFQNGGPAGAVYGFLIAWVCSTSVYIVIGELASMAPIAGGQYYWVSMLAPSSSKRFYSYMTGWLTTIAWIFTAATGAFVNGTIIQGLIVLNNPMYEFQRFHGTLLTWALIALAVFVNTILSTILPEIEGMILILHVLGFFGIMIPLVWLAPHENAKFVFTTFLNGGEWPTQGVSFCIGMIGMVATFVGSDAAVHMSEEIENAALNVPRAIITTIALNGALGFGMLLAILFCLGDIDAALNTPTGYPFIQIFVQGTGSVGGSTAMASIVMILGACATIGFVASASRMTWSFARDQGLPFSGTISKLDKRTSIPFIAVGIVATIPCLLALINIGSTTVFNAVISLSVSGFYASYFLPASLLLWRRCRGEIKDISDPGLTFDHRPVHPPSLSPAPSHLSHPKPTSKPAASSPSSSQDSNPTSSTPLTKPDPSGSGGETQVMAQPPLLWGPWRVRGVAGVANNAFACCYMVFVVFWSVWPSERHTTAENMNYSVLVTGAVLMFSVVYYWLWGWRQYKGPLVEVGTGEEGARAGA